VYLAKDFQKTVKLLSRAEMPRTSEAHKKPAKPFFGKIALLKVWILLARGSELHESVVLGDDSNSGPKKDQVYYSISEYL
jgi:hypothetical protein